MRDSDREVVDETIARLSRSRPWLARLAFAVGAFAMLFDGVKLLFTNWRLTLVQVLPAMWIWAAMFDLKAHVLRGKSFHQLTGPAVVIPLVLGVAVVTAASFYLNAVFAFAIAQPGQPKIRPAFTQARSHLPVVLASGGAVGILLGLSTVVVARWGPPWFAVSLEHRRRGDDGLLRRRAVQAGRHQARPVEAGQADGHRGRRGRRRGYLHPPVRPGPPRAAPARVAARGSCSASSCSRSG